MRCRRTVTMTNRAVAHIPRRSLQAWDPGWGESGDRAPVGRSSDVSEKNGDELLPGEAASAHSHDVDDARRWFETYDDLCRMKQKILTDLESQRADVRPEGTAEVDEDEAMLNAEYRRLRERREFWQSEIEARRRN